MALLFLFILLIAAKIFLIFGFLKTSIVLLSIFLFMFLIIGTGLFSSYLLKHLESVYFVSKSFSWKQRNAIIILGTGTVKLPFTDEIKPTLKSYARIYEGARLYFAGKRSQQFCKIIISGGDALSTGSAEAVVYRDALIDLGIDSADIEIESKSLNTFENAQFTSVLLKKNNFDQICLVTSGVHIKRALIYFKYFGIEAVPMPSDFVSYQYSFSIRPRVVHFANTESALNEYIGILRFYIYNFLGWNKKIFSRKALLQTGDSSARNPRNH